MADHTDIRKPFPKLLERINFDKLPDLALRMRKGNRTTPSNMSLTCSVDRENPMIAAHSIMWILTFSDDMKWVIRFPRYGFPDKWDHGEVEGLMSEAFTMELVRTKTTVPVPDVFAFDAQCENEAGAPYILMEYIRANRMYKVWFAHGVDPDVLKQRRLNTLRDCAQAMAQLGRFRFAKGGSLDFDEDGSLLGIKEVSSRNTRDSRSEVATSATAEVVANAKEDIAGTTEGSDKDNAEGGDKYGHLDKIFNGEGQEGESDDGDDDGNGEEDEDDEDNEEEEEEEEDGDPMYATAHPFEDPNAMLADNLTRFKSEKDDGLWIGMCGLLRLFFSWIPKDYPGEGNGQPFVLTHPNLGIQNVLVDEEGHVVAFLGWANACAEPLADGNASLPAWLTRDWDPICYAWKGLAWRNALRLLEKEPDKFDLEAGDSTMTIISKAFKNGLKLEDGFTEEEEDALSDVSDDEYVSENSPRELAFFRAAYVDFMREAAGEQAARIAYNSNMVQNLLMAASFESMMPSVLREIFKRLVDVIDFPENPNEWQDSDEEEEDPIGITEEYFWHDCCTKMEEQGELDPIRLDMLWDAFNVYCA